MTILPENKVRSHCSSSWPLVAWHRAHSYATELSLSRSKKNRHAVECEMHGRRESKRQCKHTLTVPHGDAAG